MKQVDTSTTRHNFISSILQIFRRKRKSFNPFHILASAGVIRITDNIIRAFLPNTGVEHRVIGDIGRDSRAEIDGAESQTVNVNRGIIERIGYTVRRNESVIDF